MADRLFYAFPAKPDSLGESIRAAIDDLKRLSASRNKGTRFRTWQEMQIAGRNLVDTILENIERCDVFACDLTYPNSNVTFELGYAIGRFKRIWLSLNTSIAGADQRYKRLYFNL